MSEEIEITVSPTRQRVRRILFIAGFAVAIGVVLYVYVFGGRYVSTDNAYVKANMVNVSAEVDGTVDTIYVEEKQHVKQSAGLLHPGQTPNEVAGADPEDA